MAVPASRKEKYWWQIWSGQARAHWLIFYFEDQGNNFVPDHWLTGPCRLQLYRIVKQGKTQSHLFLHYC